MSLVEKTLIIKKRGRKYFDCVIGGYKAQVLINEVSQHLAIDRVVKLQVRDLSVSSKYGTRLRFDPVAILSDRDAEELRHAAAAKREAIKWLEYAEGDVSRGMSSTNAIHCALEKCRAQEELCERLAALKSRIAINTEAYEHEKHRRQHERAQVQHARDKQKRDRVLFPFSMLPYLGKPVRRGNRLLVFTSIGQQFTINEDHPAVEGSHLLGHEGDWGSYCYFREATPEEEALAAASVATLEASLVAERARSSEKQSIQELIRSTGERPAGSWSVTGEKLLDSQDIHGGGDWFVIAEDFIWYIENNGGDGDLWSRNNVQTGGAGAIGFRVPFTHDLAARLRALGS